ncbi:hypothetical protein [Polaribacter sp.]
MSIIKENKKFERKKTQETTLNPDGKLDKNKKFDIKNKTIKEQQTKH